MWGARVSLTRWPCCCRPGAGRLAAALATMQSSTGRLASRRSPATRLEGSEVPPSFGVIDLFAGPGGLGEGFASLDQDGHRPFQVELSVESELSASRTLKVRAFLREHLRVHGVAPAEYIAFHAGKVPEPQWVDVDRHAWRRAKSEVRNVALGTESAKAAVDRRISQLRNRHEDCVLLGGPPCQAYSLVGRARIGSIKDYKPKDDPRYFLYREYLRVLHRLRPAAFVMENVKGMLSSAIEGQAVFELFLDELRSPGRGRRRTEYELHALSVDNGFARLQPTEKPRDFVLRSEDFGVPQRRHRVIIVGLREDVAHRSHDRGGPRKGRQGDVQSNANRRGRASRLAGTTQRLEQGSGLARQMGWCGMPSRTVPATTRKTRGL